jgi:hypothetical protein
MFALKSLKSVVGKPALVGAALCLFAASPASAAIVTATYTGTVKDSFDSNGVFGTPGADLGGAGYSLVFTIDDTVGTYQASTARSSIRCSTAIRFSTTQSPHPSPSTATAWRSAIHRL